MLATKGAAVQEFENLNIQLELSMAKLKRVAIQGAHDEVNTASTKLEYHETVALALKQKQQYDYRRAAKTFRKAIAIKPDEPSN